MFRPEKCENIQFWKLVELNTIFSDNDRGVLLLLHELVTLPVLLKTKIHTYLNIAMVKD